MAMAMEFAIKRPPRADDSYQLGGVIAANLFYVALGAVLGGLLRFLATHYASGLPRPHGFPLGTLLVNVLGSFIVGYVLTWSTDHSHDRWRLFAATGFCGAFTTFSAFAYESMGYWREGKPLWFAANVLLNNVLCMAAVIAGISAHRDWA